MATAADEEKEAAAAAQKLPRYNYGIIMTCDFPDENKYGGNFKPYFVKKVGWCILYNVKILKLFVKRASF